MKLEQLVPKRSSIYLSETDKTYQLRPWTLKDQIWMKEQYGDNAKDMFHLSIQNLEFSVVARMLYRVIEDKSDFIAKEIVDIDEDGNQRKVTLGGYQALINMVTGFKEQISLVTALAECIGGSNSYIEDVKKIGDMELDDFQKKSL